MLYEGVGTWDPSSNLTRQSKHVLVANLVGDVEDPSNLQGRWAVLSGNDPSGFQCKVGGVVFFVVGSQLFRTSGDAWA